MNVSQITSVHRLCIAYLDAKITTINVVAKEEVSCVSGVTTNFEQFHEIKLGGAVSKNSVICHFSTYILPMNVSAY
jgi:hypothetical protein